MTDRAGNIFGIFVDAVDIWVPDKKQTARRQLDNIFLFVVGPYFFIPSLRPDWSMFTGIRNNRGTMIGPSLRVG